MKRFAEYLVSVDLSDKDGFNSQTLFIEMAILNPNAISKAQSAFQFITDKQIQGVLIGGMAVSHWAAERKLTPDVDFLVPNVDLVKSILTDEGIPFYPLLSAANLNGIQVTQYDADFMDEMGGEVPASYVLQTAKPAIIGGVSFKVADPGVLAISKFSIGREKDNEDAFKLLKSGSINKSEFKKHLKALKNYLIGELDAKTIWTYADAFIN